MRLDEIEQSLAEIFAWADEDPDEVVDTPPAGRTVRRGPVVATRSRSAIMLLNVSFHPDERGAREVLRKMQQRRLV